MTTITLNKPVTIVPAQEAVTANSFVVTYIEENYGVFTDEQDGPQRRPGRGRQSSVIADVEIGTAPGPVSYRSITVWEGDAYLAVRGTWTDQDLYNRVKEILEAE
jgi:hypothetical protein